MKLILSRKGFDSGSGGVANPLLPDGRLLALPIPDPQSPIRYDDIPFEDINLGELVSQLTRGKVLGCHGAHLDPDLWYEHQPRHSLWRPLLGQHGAAQSHLAGRGVGPGDLFLFFGWFREVIRHAEGQWGYSGDRRGRHIIYGWLQVDRVLDLREEGGQAWMHYHPHFHGERKGANTLYLARKTLSLQGKRPGLAGAGFLDYRADRVLTMAGENRSIWQVPHWLHPEGRASTLSYHERAERWCHLPGGTLLDSAKRGQEFVLDLDHYPEAIGWLNHLLKPAGRG